MKNMDIHNIFRYIKKHYKLAITVTYVVICSYWLGGFIMFLYCMSIVAKLKISGMFWLIPLLILASCTFIMALLLQNKKIYEEWMGNSDGIKDIDKQLINIAEGELVDGEDE